MPPALVTDESPPRPSDDTDDRGTPLPVSFTANNRHPPPSRPGATDVRRTAAAHLENLAEAKPEHLKPLPTAPSLFRAAHSTHGAIGGRALHSTGSAATRQRRRMDRHHPVLYRSAKRSGPGLFGQGGGNPATGINTGDQPGVSACALDWATPQPDAPTSSFG